MLVSVVMPVYNAALYLKEAIQSLLDQTYVNWELIAVDDGSTDNSWEILRSYSDPRIKIFQRDEGIKIIHQLNKGVRAARNAALELMNGDYFTFLV